MVVKVNKRTSDYIIFNIIAYVVVGLLAIITLLPFVVLVVSSFASESYIINHGYTLVPREFSLEAYKLVFLNPQKMMRSYGVTIFVTVVGTAISLFIASMAAYVMFRKDLKYRNHLSFFLYFTTLFNGGLVPYYLLLTTYLRLKNTLLVLLLVPMFNVFNILILRNFIRSAISESVIESAKIDGAGDFGIFLRIILPLSKPALACIGFFTALNYWNDWWTAMMFVDTEALYPLQYMLYLILSSVQVAANVVDHAPTLEMPKESLKLAMTVVATGPIMLLYPFVQKFFVRGIMMGAIKG